MQSFPIAKSGVRKRQLQVRRQPGLASPAEPIMNAQMQTHSQPSGMPPVIFENPMGIDGFEFVEFASPEPAKLHELFRNLGFVQVARHKTRPIYNYRQGDCTFLINEDPDSFATVRAAICVSNEDEQDSPG